MYTYATVAGSENSQCDRFHVLAAGSPIRRAGIAARIRVRRIAARTTAMSQKMNCAKRFRELLGSGG
jgi:hypothetical protein